MTDGRRRSGGDVRLRRLWLAGLVLGGMLLGVPDARADHGPGCPAPAVDPPTRFGRIAAGNKYLNSLVTHDTSEVPVAEDVVRVENGAVSADGAQAICEGNEEPGALWVTTGIRDLRWFVDGENAISIYMLDTVGSPSYIVERFRVVDGLIQEIEAVFYIDPAGYAVGPESVVSRPDGVVERLLESSHGPLGPLTPTYGSGDTEAPDRAARGQVRNAAQRYLDALVSHDASRVPLADQATRMENRRARGDSGPEIRAALESPAMDSLTGMQRPTIYVDGDQAIAIYLLETTAKDPVVGDVLETWAATRFHVTDGMIDEIETVCWGSELCGATS